MYLVLLYIQGGKEGAKAESQGFSPLFTFSTFKSFICPPYLHCIACRYFMRSCYDGINEQGVRIFRVLYTSKSASRERKNSKNNKRACSTLESGINVAPRINVAPGKFEKRITVASFLPYT